MNTDREFPYNLEADLGEFLEVEEFCPGIFYISAKSEDYPIALEYLVLKSDNTILSEIAKSYGKVPDFATDVLLYYLDDNFGGRQVAMYEVMRYRATHGMPPLSYGDVADIAVFGMENNPEYFGAFPVPIHTTRGKTLRYKTLARGVFAIETSTFERVVAICYPIWACDISDYVKTLGELLPGEKDTVKTLPYLFFPEHSACLALFEIWNEYPVLAKSPCLNYAAIMNAVWERFPEFAAARNIHEQSGDNDVSAKLLKLTGIEIEPKLHPENMVYLTPEAGTDYLNF